MDPSNDPLDLDALEALAKAATPRWYAKIIAQDDHTESVAIEVEGDQRMVALPGWRDAQGHADMRFIAALNPTVVLDLITALRTARQERDEHMEHAAHEEMDKFLALEALDTLKARLAASQAVLEGLLDGLDPERFSGEPRDLSERQWEQRIQKARAALAEAGEA